jgi:hypothetical protein
MPARPRPWRGGTRPRGRTRGGGRAAPSSPVEAVLSARRRLTSATRARSRDRSAATASAWGSAVR